MEIQTKKLEIYKEFHDKIKSMVRDSGRTNILSLSGVDAQIVDTGNKLYELENEDNTQ